MKYLRRGPCTKKGESRQPHLEEGKGGRKNVLGRFQN
jgi:hypothetical protein